MPPLPPGGISLVDAPASSSTATTVGTSPPARSPPKACYTCGGAGYNPCPLCGGGGVLAIDDSVVIDREVKCPSCNGAGILPCAACVGLGLANVAGILRAGARDGRLRMRRDGAVQVLDCEAFPACVHAARTGVVHPTVYMPPEVEAAGRVEAGGGL
ncbi:hypothetical protein MMPV_004899 [Pyropia vietnamensis]